MSPPIKRTAAWHGHDYSMIIDVRSESEFADDHIPGAVSMPVLKDVERAEIGTLYKQVSPFEAKRRGAAIVARNIAHHIDTKLADAPKDFAPLVYCWRGGQRSGAMARILSEIGWQVTVVEGGYKGYRKQVLDGLDSIPPSLRLIVLRGRTGTAKTAILRAAADKGAQVIDLEGMAVHRGSLLGPEPGRSQPAQRQFESRIHDLIRRFDPDRPVFIEAESNKVGACHVPPALWQRMRGADSVLLEVPVGARVAFLLQDYQHVIDEPERLAPLLSWVTTRIGHEAVAAWRQHIDTGDWPGFVGRVLEDHYDPAYDRSAAKRDHRDIATITSDSLDEDAISALSSQLCEMR